ncbi:hypothetical protein [Formosa sp. Hel1_31_208]|uniref:hypothetical protein n=1 Tax=Formosa sp. Hel1_31_208 TaxID=1798225 RepID=UPI000B834D4D|nr:hypothetical protein [Formosa sp. Hel1_31_208]
MSYFLETKNDRYESDKDHQLCIAFAGLLASFFGLISGDAVMDHFMTLICSICLIYSYFEFNKTINPIIKTDCAKDGAACLSSPASCFVLCRKRVVTA